MASLLLDTEAFIWWDANDPHLGGNAPTAIQDGTNVYVSTASAWEIAIKASLGELRTTRRPMVAVEESGFQPLPVTFEHAEAGCVRSRVTIAIPSIISSSPRRGSKVGQS